jgi:hypothetical protein
MLAGVATALYGQASPDRGTLFYALHSQEPAATQVYNRVTFVPGFVISTLNAGESGTTALIDYDAGMFVGLVYNGKDTVPEQVVGLDQLLELSLLNPLDIEVRHDSTKTILGFKCLKFTARPRTDPEAGLYMQGWFTEDLRTPFKLVAGLDAILPGLPLVLGLRAAGQSEELTTWFVAEKFVPRVDEEHLAQSRALVKKLAAQQGKAGTSDKH